MNEKLKENTSFDEYLDTSVEILVREVLQRVSTTFCKEPNDDKELSLDCEESKEKLWYQKRVGPVDWTTLPPEVWMKIFSYISQAELFFNIYRVCKQWNAWCKDSSLWKKVDFNQMHEDLKIMHENAKKHSRSVTFPKNMKSDVFKRIVRLYSCEISSIKMSRFTDDFALSEKHSLNHLRCCSNITVLDLGFCDFDVSMICRSCSHIHTLILEGCRFLRSSDFSEIKRLQCLYKLDVSHCTDLDDEFLPHLYDLKNLRALISDGVMRLTEVGLIQFFLHQPLMEVLVLDGEDMSDDLVCYASSHLPNLVTFELSFCQCLTDRSMLAFRKKHKLEQLCFRKASNLTTTPFLTVFDQHSLFKLKKISITECEEIKDDALIAISACCPHLERIAVEWCYSISDVGIECLVKSCKKLHTLSLVGLFRIKGESWLNDLDVTLRDLVFLDLTDCDNIPDDKLFKLFSRRPYMSIYSYYHDKVCLDDVDGHQISPLDEESDEWKCPGETGVKVDF